MPKNCFSGTVRDSRSLLKRAEAVSIGSLSFVCVKKWANITYKIYYLDYFFSCILIRVRVQFYFVRVHYLLI